ncbi:MAG: M28 family peptidase [Gemmatimonadetes bacterium]|nr:M28 family peptidase [Gemmatimonadota bacterium]
MLKRKHLPIVPLAILLAVLGCGGSDSASRMPAIDAPALSGREIADHMRTLSSDEFLGRGPGHIGGERAADYIARNFADIGLEAPNGSYFQTVPMVGTTTDPSTASLSFEGPRGSVAASYLDGFVINAGDPEADGAGGEAEVVFVGYGITAPENDWDDFGDVDVAGKYVMILVNDPPAPPSEPDLFGGVAMTYYGRWTYKYEEAARRGALGALIVHETGPAGYPWSVVRGGWSGEQFALPPDPNGAPPAGLVGWISLEVARALLAAGGHDFDDLKADAAKRDFRAVPTGVVARARVESTVRRVETVNVIGLLTGSERPDEYVTFTSHYDHFGVGEVIDGDSIYNGAYDNASGTALLMTMAHAFIDMPARPARSILFIATAAEEQGLLGAQWYVQAPLFPLAQTVAEVNIDGANLWGETTDMIAQGEERSELGAFVRSRAEELGITLRPDAEPEKGFFFRSDHFPFARAGVPSLYVEHGRQYIGRPSGWGDDIQSEYTANRYHAPSDAFSEDFVFGGAVQQGTLVFLTILDIANSASWPNWHEGQEFKGARDAMMGARQ